jgi:hypothetical protein
MNHKGTKTPRPPAQLFLCFVSLGLCGSTARAAEDPWALGLGYAFNDAERAFQAAPNSRAKAVGHAAALLNVQPRTGAALTGATRLLSAIARENAHDDAGVTARYLLARIADLHHTPRDPLLAAKLYRELVVEDAAHPLAQAAAVKLAMLLLYDAAQPDVAARFAAAEALVPSVTLPGPRSDLLVVLGRSALHLKRPPRDALRWFAEARRVGFSLRQAQADTLVTLADLALEAGDTALGRDCLAEFVREFPRDNRCSWLRTRLASLPAP